MSMFAATICSSVGSPAARREKPQIAHLYGVATVEATEEDDVVRITGLVEKPAFGTAPSNLAVIGRYVLCPEVFEVLENTPRPGAPASNGRACSGRQPRGRSP